jgi:hypothetical protein
VGRFTDPLVLEHDGGHVIPAERAVAEPIARFLARFASFRSPVAPNSTMT